MPLQVDTHLQVPLYPGRLGELVTSATTTMYPSVCTSFDRWQHTRQGRQRMLTKGDQKKKNKRKKPKQPGLPMQRQAGNAGSMTVARWRLAQIRSRGHKSIGRYKIEHPALPRKVSREVPREVPRYPFYWPTCLPRCWRRAWRASLATTGRSGWRGPVDHPGHCAFSFLIFFPSSFFPSPSFSGFAEEEEPSVT